MTAAHVGATSQPIQTPGVTMRDKRHRALKRLLAKLPPRFRWAPHNMIAHPLSEVLFQLGLEDLSNDVHDATVPYHTPGTGRG